MISRTRYSEANPLELAIARPAASIQPTPSTRRYAPALWALLALFCLRVLGQMLVAFFGVDWLPSMEQWYSGLLPYHVLLPAQLLIIALLAKVCLDFSRGQGYFVEPHLTFGTYLLWFGYVYLAVMLVRYPVRMYLHPEARWFGQTIPIFFHWVLAIYLILVGRYHRHQTIEARAQSSA